MSQATGIVLPTDPQERKRLKGQIEEIAHAMTRKGAEMTLISEYKKTIKKDYELGPKTISRLAKAFNEGSFDEQLAEATAEAEEFEEAYEILFK